jgi:hypothetical protein
VVIENSLVKLVQELGAFFWIQFVDVFWEVADPEEAFPPTTEVISTYSEQWEGLRLPSDGICPNERVYSS